METLDIMEQKKNNLLKYKPTPEQNEASKKELLHRYEKSLSVEDRKWFRRTYDSTPNLYQRGFLKALLGESSAKQAIKQQCIQCVGWQRNEVALCKGVMCPLYAHRPYK